MPTPAAVASAPQRAAAAMAGCELLTRHPPDEHEREAEQHRCGPPAAGDAHVAQAGEQRDRAGDDAQLGRAGKRDADQRQAHRERDPREKDHRHRTRCNPEQVSLPTHVHGGTG